MGCHELDLNIYNFADDKSADDNHDAARIEQVLPNRIVKEHLGISRRHNVQNDQQRHRQAPKNPSGEPALRCLGTDFAFNADAVANNASRAVKNFSEIAAGFLLHQNRSNKEVQILRWNAVAQL